MLTGPKPLISEDLMHQIEETAHAQNREPADVVQEAVSRYLASRRLAVFAEKMEQRAAEKGIRQEDISRLLQEVRRENEARGR